MANLSLVAMSIFNGLAQGEQPLISKSYGEGPVSYTHLDVYKRQTGHGALAGLLAEQGISVLICGGIGGGAQSLSLIHI